MNGSTVGMAMAMIFAALAVISPIAAQVIQEQRCFDGKIEAQWCTDVREG